MSRQSKTEKKCLWQQVREIQTPQIEAILQHLVSRLQSPNITVPALFMYDFNIIILYGNMIFINTATCFQNKFIKITNGPEFNYYPASWINYGDIKCCG